MSAKTKTDIASKTEKEINKCILLKAEERKHWLALVNKASPLLLESIYRIFTKNNKLMDKYVLEAFKHEPELLDQLKQKIVTVKKTAIKLNEASERPIEIEEAEKAIKSL
jgi:hypothetical protein